jgi:branched-chain amino acid transport system substrate-binding protein
MSLNFKQCITILMSFLCMSCSSEPRLPMTSPATVLVMLPLSGEFSHIGKSYLRSIEMIHFATAAPNLTLKIVDSGGLYESAVQALKNTKKVDIVIGAPIPGELDALKMWSLKFGVPVISLCNLPSKATEGVFIFGISIKTEIDRMVRYASSQKMERFTAILPEGVIGSAIKDALETAAKNTSSTVVDIFFYGPSLSEIPKIIQTMKTKKSDAIFVPMGGVELMSIAKSLSAAHISGKILGSQFWKSSDVDHLQELSGAWYTTCASKQRDVFEAEYAKSYKEDAEPNAFLAYDAMAVIAKIHKMSLNNMFSISAFSIDSGFSGVEGVFRFSKDGRVVRRIAIKEIQNGNSTVIDGGSIE